MSCIKCVPHCTRRFPMMFFKDRAFTCLVPRRALVPTRLQTTLVTNSSVSLFGRLLQTVSPSCWGYWHRAPAPHKNTNGILCLMWKLDVVDEQRGERYRMWTSSQARVFQSGGSRRRLVAHDESCNGKFDACCMEGREKKSPQK